MTLSEAGVCVSTGISISAVIAAVVSAEAWPGLFALACVFTGIAGAIWVFSRENG